MSLFAVVGGFSWLFYKVYSEPGLYNPVYSAAKNFEVNLMFYALRFMVGAGFGLVAYIVYASFSKK